MKSGRFYPYITSGLPWLPLRTHDFQAQDLYGIRLGWLSTDVASYGVHSINGFGLSNSGPNIHSQVEIKLIIHDPFNARHWYWASIYLHTLF